MSRSARTAAAAVVLLVGIGATSLAAVPAAADHRPAFCTGTSTLPRSADAAETWLRACSEADRHPKSADAADRQARSDRSVLGGPWAEAR